MEFAISLNKDRTSTCQLIGRQTASVSKQSNVRPLKLISFARPGLQPSPQLKFLLVGQHQLGMPQGLRNKLVPLTIDEDQQTTVSQLEYSKSRTLNDIRKGLGLSTTSSRSSSSGQSDCQDLFQQFR